MNLRGPKGKIARRLGIPLSPRTARILEKRPTPPGQHGAERPRKTSEYKKQLTEKQRLRAQYNISEAQLKLTFARAVKMSGNSGQNLLQLLEQRLDALVHRAGLAPTIFAARQLVAHGHFTVNGKACRVPSRRVNLGDQVAPRPRSAELAVIADAMNRVRIPGYLDVDAGKKSVRMTSLPLRDEIPVICEVPLVVEFYSR